MGLGVGGIHSVYVCVGGGGGVEGRVILHSYYTTAWGRVVRGFREVLSKTRKVI
jgi:hypothetical protein